MFDNAGTVTLHEKEVQSIKMDDSIIYQKSENTPLYTVHILFDDSSLAPRAVRLTTDSNQIIMVQKVDGWIASLPIGTQTITAPSLPDYQARVTQMGYDISIRYNVSSTPGLPVTYVIEEVSQ